MVPKLVEALKICRSAGMHVIYTAHVHRRDGCDMGRFRDLHPLVASHDALVDGTPGVDIYPELTPAPGEHVIKKHRYSGFFGTDLDIILREWGVRYGNHFRDNDGELLPCNGTGCHVPQLSCGVPVGRNGDIRLSRSRLWSNAECGRSPRDFGHTCCVNGARNVGCGPRRAIGRQPRLGRRTLAGSLSGAIFRPLRLACRGSQRITLRQ